MSPREIWPFRCGGAETSVKGSKQGLGLINRNKHRFAAQAMLIQLSQLAGNVEPDARSRFL